MNRDVLHLQLTSARCDETNETSCKLETSDSFYHSLLRDDNEDNVPRYEGVEQTHCSETTHMSWDEVRHSRSQ